MNWLHIAMRQEQYQDMRREAQRDWLAQQAQQSCEPGHPWYGRAFAWLGGQMMAGGQSLQARFGSTPTTLQVARQPC